MEEYCGRTYRHVEQTGIGWQKTWEEISYSTWILELDAPNWKGKPSKRIQHLRHACDRNRQPESPSYLPLGR